MSDVTQATGDSSGAPNATPVSKSSVPKGLWTVKKQAGMAWIVCEAEGAITSARPLTQSLLTLLEEACLCHNATLPVSTKEPHENWCSNISEHGIRHSIENHLPLLPHP